MRVRLDSASSKPKPCSNRVIRDSSQPVVRDEAVRVMRQFTVTSVAHLLLICPAWSRPRPEILRERFHAQDLCPNAMRLPNLPRARPATVDTRRVGCLISCGEVGPLRGLVAKQLWRHLEPIRRETGQSRPSPPARPRLSVGVQSVAVAATGNRVMRRKFTASKILS